MKPDTSYQCEVSKPEDFDEFWDSVISDVAKIDLAPSIQKDDLRTDEDVEVYQVHYNSIDGV